jgi:hypothetical protein
MLSSRMKLASFYDEDEIIAEHLRFGCRLSMNYALGLSRAGPIVVISLPSQNDETVARSLETPVYPDQREMGDTPISSSRSQEDPHAAAHTYTNNSDRLLEHSDILHETPPSSSLEESFRSEFHPSKEVLFRGTKLDMPLWLAQGLLLQYVA